LTGSSGPGTGDWRLELRSALDLEAIAYVQTTDGYLETVHEVASIDATGSHYVPIFTPASNLEQKSLLRLVNLGDEATIARVTGVDDRGESPGETVQVEVPAGASVTLDTAELETGGADIQGALGDGEGWWRLWVAGDGQLAVLNLLESTEGYLSNLSSVAAAELERGGVHHVPLFLSASDPFRRHGFARVINRSDRAGDVRIQPFDALGRQYERLNLSLHGGQAVHLTSNDLELGNVDKGLAGSAGSGAGDWRLELSSELDLDVLVYVHMPSGFLTSMHDVAEPQGRRYGVSIFNAASNTNQASRLRIVNPGRRPAHLSVAGIDDAGTHGEDVAQLSVPAGETAILSASQLEEGRGHGLRDAIGDGDGKWRLTIDSEQPILLMGLLETPSGLVTNLSASFAPTHH
jgi:hypothetical protein